MHQIWIVNEQTNLWWPAVVKRTIQTVVTIRSFSECRWNAFYHVCLILELGFFTGRTVLREDPGVTLINDFRNQGQVIAAKRRRVLPLVIVFV